jgi:hypothetical protein
MKIDW